VNETLTTVDLFAGAGGLSLGFELSGQGFLPTLAVESDQAAARTFKRHFGCQVDDSSIEQIDVFPEADVVIGGPPCQGFSPLGQTGDAMVREERNELWQEYLRAVRQIQPKAFVIENVPQFLRSAQFQALLETLRSDRTLRTYGIQHGVLNAADYGVAQVRRRGFLIAVRGEEPTWPPPPSHGSESKDGTPHLTVRDAIGDLPLEPTDEDLHWRRNPHEISHERYRAVPEGGNRFDLAANRPDLLPPCWRKKTKGSTDVFGRMWWDRPAPTIRTEFFKPEKGRYLHPAAHRPITHREAARLQSFPDSFEFEGSRTQVARQIGNAVPPELGRAIANYLARLLGQSGK
jgi:DNA (cytosine-5)-methyltransferase 1